MPRLKGNASDTALKKIVQKINDYELSSGEIVSDLELSNELNLSLIHISQRLSSFKNAHRPSYCLNEDSFQSMEL